MGANEANTPLLKIILEEVMEDGLEDHIAEGDQPNDKNGKGKKKI